LKQFQDLILDRPNFGTLIGQFSVEVNNKSLISQQVKLIVSQDGHPKALQAEIII
jgi:hypothetical protein